VLRLFRTAVLLAALPALAGAQSHPGGDDGEAAATSQASEARIYLGMWTAHLTKLGKGIRNNWLVAVSWRGFYGGTFVNSFGDRAFTAGIQRTLARGSEGAFVPTIGYRLGFVTGYDRRFLSLADKVPALPVAQLVGGVDHGRAGVELSWAGVVGSLGPRFRP